MKKNLKRYRYFIIGVIVLFIITIINNEIGKKAIDVTLYSLKEMLVVIPPIFILLGLLDVWVPREIMIKYMGEGSGFKGVVLAFLFGALAAGPLYGAFPVAAVFMKKGVKFSNLVIFIGAWSTLKIPMLLFEITSLGLKFALTRMLIDIPGILLIALTMQKLISSDEQKVIYLNAEMLDSTKS